MIWRYALRLAGENQRLRARVDVLELACVKKDRTIRRLAQDASIVAAMVRDPRDAADFLQWDREAEAS